MIIIYEVVLSQRRAIGGTALVQRGRGRVEGRVVQNLLRYWWRAANAATFPFRLPMYTDAWQLSRAAATSTVSTSTTSN